MQKSFYLFSDGQISRKDNTVVFESEGKKRFLPIEQIGVLYVFGEVDTNKRFLELASKYGILIHFFNYYGYYVGTYYPREHLNSGYMVLQQSAAYLDEARRLELASLFVLGAMKNMTRVLSYYKRRGVDVDEELEVCQSAVELVGSQESIERLMALEGNTRESYYQVFDKILANPDFRFEKRSRRPPQNRVNTLISFGNSFLYTAVLSEIYKTHLDPRIGFLHATNFRRFSLNLDVAEIFKPIIVDRAIFDLVSHRVITASDFDEDTQGIILKERGRKSFVAELDKRLSTVIQVRSLNRRVSYRRLIRVELYKIEKHLMQEKIYKPFIARW
ncbi:MAG: type I-B CRISPR-associated endonuclease Cas1b [Bacillota bacterium]|nr:type I-B CRISPR-associated endonuclease Cas1b [Bacillota bacterium]